MSENNSREPMLEMFIFETLQLLDQLEQSLITSEKQSNLESSVNEIFRIMHTIKGSAAMMLFDSISSLAHSIEDLFFFLREGKPTDVAPSKIIDIVLDGVDFIKNETAKIENGMEADGDASNLIQSIKEYLDYIKSCNIPYKIQGQEEKGKEKSYQYDNQKYYISSKKTDAKTAENKYEAVLYFEEGCEMENIRAFSVVHQLKEITEVISYYPEDVMENNESVATIQSEGFRVVFKTDLDLEQVRKKLYETIFLKSLEVYVTDDALFGSENAINYKESEALAYEEQKKPIRDIVLDDTENNTYSKDKTEPEVIFSEEHNTEKKLENDSSSGKQSVISVNIVKLDMLMDLVGELVISEAMVTQNPELEGLKLENFNKATRQLNKITNELQDIVMSIRMVPLSMTFRRMNRIVRDMSKKLNKVVNMEIVGEETEVDKNIIERLSDPLIHLIRNSIDHGIEEVNERVEKGKSPAGHLILEAKNAGGDVWIIVKDDGKGLDKEKILRIARENGLIHKPESELSDKEIFSFIFLPGFSTSENVTEFSGRGVGMDIVTKNIQMAGGSIQVDSIPGQGTTFLIKFPLTLAIIDGMAIKVGQSRYTIPTISIKKSFRVSDEAVIKDTEGNEMIMVRGECYPVLRLHTYYRISTEITDIKDGIIIMVENDSKSFCLFADMLLGEQQVVVKALPKYIKKVKGISGCTLLGDGNISLILDIASLL